MKIRHWLLALIALAAIHHERDRSGAPKLNLHSLREQLAKLKIAIGKKEHRQEIAGNRWQANHDLAHREHKRQKEAERLAVKYGKEGHAKASDAESQKAARCRYRATKAHDRAIYWVGKTKLFAGQLGKLKGAEHNHEAAIKRIELANGPKRTSADKVEGGTERERLLLFQHLSMLHGSKYYSQVGPTDVFHGITGPTPGHRHDCSSWFTSGYCSCGLRNPNEPADHMDFDNGETMYTGTLGAHGESISESQLDTGDAILFGYEPFHHVEQKHGPMSQSDLTVGHGDAQINYGNTHLLPGPRSFHRYVKN